MVNKELVTFIENAIKKGHRFDHIKKTLLDAGHKLEDIEKAHLHVKKKKLELYGGILLTVIILIALIALLVDIFSVEQPKLSENEILDSAILSGNVSNCNELDPVKRALCARTITEGDKMIKTEPSKTENTIVEAVEKNDSSICDSISSSVEKQVCLIETGAIKREKESIVENSTIVKDQELLDQAYQSGNSSICAGIINDILKQICYEDLENS